MQTRPRWMNALLTEVEGCKTRMPWERGLRRQAFVARRAGLQPTPPAPRPLLMRAPAPQGELRLVARA